MSGPCPRIGSAEPGGKFRLLPGVDPGRARNAGRSGQIGGSDMEKKHDLGPGGEFPDAVRDLDYDESALYALFFRCSHILSRRVGIRVSRQRVLSLLAQRGEMPQRELREALGVQAGSFSELAARLEERGFLTREQDPADRRRILLRLTDAGRERAARDAQARDQELFCALNQEEQAELRALLQKIADGHEAWKKRRGIR